MQLICAWRDCVGGQLYIWYVLSVILSFGVCGVQLFYWVVPGPKSVLSEYILLPYRKSSCVNLSHTGQYFSTVVSQRHGCCAECASIRAPVRTSKFEFMEQIVTCGNFLTSFYTVAFICQWAVQSYAKVDRIVNIPCCSMTHSASH